MLSFLYIIVYLRLGSSQLCADHIKHLIKVSVALVERCDCVEAIMLDTMITRLYDLLNEDAKTTLIDNLIDLNTDYYVSSLHLLMAKNKSLLSERLRNKIEDLPKAFLDLQEHPSVRNWKRLVRRIKCIRYIKLVRLFYKLEEIFMIIIYLKI